LIPDVLADDFRLRVGNLPPGFSGLVITGETVDRDNMPVHDATVILIPKDPWRGSIDS
jgi:hypothetical protein